MKFVAEKGEIPPNVFKRRLAKWLLRLLDVLWTRWTRTYPGMDDEGADAWLGPPPRHQVNNTSSIFCWVRKHNRPGRHHENLRCSQVALMQCLQSLYGLQRYTFMMLRSMDTNKMTAGVWQKACLLKLKCQQEDTYVTICRPLSQYNCRSIRCILFQYTNQLQSETVPRTTAVHRYRTEKQRGSQVAYRGIG